MISLRHCHLDSRECAHPPPAALLRAMGEHLFCGHCGADLPDLLPRTLIRCDGQAVRVTQADFGDIHVCGRDMWAEQRADLTLDLSASI